jgi:glutathione S-transferase
MLTLFYEASTCALASHIVLEEAGAAYEAVRVDFSKEEQKQPAYLAINPKARVPALVTDRGVLTETPAILAFIAQSHPGAALAPLGDPFEFARVQAFNSYLCSTVHVAHAHRRRGERWVDDNPGALEAMQQKVPANMAACFALMEREMFAGPWVMGAAYTICDAYLFTIAQWLESDSVDPAQFPRIHAHRQRMAERPAVMRAIAQERR